MSVQSAYDPLDVSLDGESDPSISSGGRPRATSRAGKARSISLLKRQESADAELDAELSEEVDMEAVLVDAKKLRAARKQAEFKQQSRAWRCARAVCGEPCLFRVKDRRYWRETEELYREQAELEAIRVTMIQGTSQAVGRMLQRSKVQLELDEKCDDDERVITSIFLRMWLQRKIKQAQVHIPFVFDMDHQRENFVTLSPFHSRHKIHGAITPAELTYRNYKAKQSVDWSSLSVDLQTEIFKKCDTDGSGELEKQEIFNLFESLNVNVTETKVDQLFRKADTDGNGRISQDEVQGVVDAALEFEKNKERDSLHRAEQIVLGENQLIDRFGRLASRALIEIYAEQALLECIIKKRETVTAKSIAFAFTAVYIVMKFGLDLAEDYILAGSSDSLN